MDVTEQEHADRLQAWWHANAKQVVMSILMVIALYLGWQYWTHHQQVVKSQASEAYARLIQHMDTQDDESFEASVERIVEQYADMPYSAMANLLLAHRYVSKSEFEQAQSALSWVVDNAQTAVLSDIARIRSARLAMANEDFVTVQRQLEGASTETFGAIVQELRGDLYQHQGETEKAIEAYQAALRSDPVGLEVRKTFILMKLNDLGVDPEDIDIPLD